MTTMTMLLATLMVASWLVPAFSTSIAETGAFCFSGTATVSVYGKGHVAMKDLKVGDYVVTGT